MQEHEERTYRERITTEDLVSFNVKVKETDLWISSDTDLTEDARDLVFGARYQIESYIKSHPEFLTNLQPSAEDPYTSPIVGEMIRTTRDLGIGPMASVAGAVAQYVGEGLLELTDQVIVENGGDIFLKINRPATVSIFAGESPISGKLGLVIPVRLMPLGICSSSGTVGHSLSMGSSDVICVMSPSPILADAAATVLGNRINSKKDIDNIPNWAGSIDGILGGVAIMDDKMSAWGDINLVEL
jgi:ApbE superfamily uncharacterized protein (UPF0280 family)